MFLQLTQKDGKALLVNVMNVLFEETDSGLVVHFEDKWWIVEESLNYIKYSIAQAFAAQANSNSARLVT